MVAILNISGFIQNNPGGGEIIIKKKVTSSYDC